MTKPMSAFRLGDVRGRYPDDLDEAFARRFALAFCERFGIEGIVATGRDMRASSPGLQAALNDGFRAAGVDVMDLGLCTTELGYFASMRPPVAASIIVTASHNPPVYNGFKCVLAGGRAVTFETGLADVQRLMQVEDGPAPEGRGQSIEFDLARDYITFLSKRFDPGALDVGAIALNGLNGTAATLAVNIVHNFGLSATWFRAEPGPIPDEGADPSKPRLIEEMRRFMADRAFALGVAWDGDCDRCVFFSGNGDLVPTYYIIGLLAENFLAANPGRAIVFDTKLCWNTLDVVRAAGGIPVPSETGHAFVKRHMRESDAIYGGELSSHHFFGDFQYCDSGMFAWLKVMEIIATSGRTIDELVAARRAEICCTPEISVDLIDIDRAFAAIDTRFAGDAVLVDHFDGPSYEMPGEWRFSLRRSKTEPLVRINFESRGGHHLLLERAAGVLDCLRPFQASEADPADDLRVQ